MPAVLINDVGGIAAINGYKSTEPVLGHPVGRIVQIDTENGGAGYIEDTVEVKDKGYVWRRVRLYRQSDGRKLAETWSDPVTGKYRFNDLKLGQDYFVCSFDHTLDKRAVIADRVPLKVAP